MKFLNYNFYFETSAVNFLADKYNFNDAIATKALQNINGNIWYLSPVTLWEISLTRDLKRREEILFFCQNLFCDKLLNSPSEFIVKYINAGCPEIEKKYNFHSKLKISEAWEDICTNRQKTLKYDYNSLYEKMKLFQNISRQLDKIIHRIVLDLNVSDDELIIQLFINNIYFNIKDQLVFNDPDYHKIIKISILFMFYILCLEAEIDNSPTKEFWQKIGIKSPFDRLIYLMKIYKSLVLRGPFYQMAIMAFHQISFKNKSNRGLFMDCLHSIYLTYTDAFITNDEHFKTLKEREIHPNFLKLIHIKDIKFDEKLKKISNQNV